MIEVFRSLNLGRGFVFCVNIFWKMLKNVIFQPRPPVGWTGEGVQPSTEVQPSPTAPAVHPIHSTGIFLIFNMDFWYFKNGFVVSSPVYFVLGYFVFGVQQVTTIDFLLPLKEISPQLLRLSQNLISTWQLSLIGTMLLFKRTRLKKSIIFQKSG